MSEAVRLSVRIVPRASRDVVVGMRSGALLVRVTAAPVDGAANEALLRLLARRLHLGKGSFKIVTGKTSKVKVIEIVGLDEAELMRRLVSSVVVAIEVDDLDDAGDEPLR